MQQFAQTCEAVAATTKKTDKVRLVADYFRSRSGDEAALAAIFLSGRAFPAWDERTLQVGGALLWRTVAEISGKSEAIMRAAYRKFGDLGAAAAEVLAEVGSRKSTLSLDDLSALVDELARTPAAAQKGKLLQDFLSRATPVEAKYIIKIIGGDLRIGLKESLVEEAIARAFDENLARVQRANMLLGDIAGTLRLAAAHELSSAQMRLFHPIGFMLASPAADAGEALSYFPRAAVEDKYDGVRAHAHCGGANDRRVRLFSRTLDEISESFPELPPALRAFPEPVILDGEILAWDRHSNQALPFSALQKRLGRKKVPDDLLHDVPVAYVAFDALYSGHTLLIDLPLEERRKKLEQILSSVPDGGFHVAEAMATGNPQGKLLFPAQNDATKDFSRVMLAPAVTASSPEQLDEIFAQARARGNE